MKKIKKPLLIVLSTLSALLFLSLIFLTITSAKGPIRTVEGIVTHVMDGDTLKLETAEGTVLRVRLYGIDAPELQRVNRRTGEISKQGQPFGEEAYRALESRVINKKVRVDIVDIDRYRRMVGIVHLDNRNINLEMVREGWAWAYRQYLDRPYASEYLGAENEARSKRLGLWQQANPQPPWEFRKITKEAR
jgi:endonuclease YncB( thermonuclease family)